MKKQKSWRKEKEALIMEISAHQYTARWNIRPQCFNAGLIFVGLPSTKTSFDAEKISEKISCTKGREMVEFRKIEG